MGGHHAFRFTAFSEMPAGAVTQRKRENLLLLNEYAHVSIEALNAAAQFVACFSFYEGAKKGFYKFGVWAFLLTSAVSTIMFLNTIHDNRKHIHSLGKDSSPEEKDWARAVQQAWLYMSG